MNGRSAWRLALLASLALEGAASSGCSSSNDAGTGAETGPANDTGADSEATDSGLDASAAEGAADSTVEDSASGDMDSAPDSQTEKDAASDTSPETDSGAETGSGMDAAAEGAPDAEPDAVADTGTGADATTDTGADAGGDAGDGAPSLVPCTTAGQTNCVSCDGWATMVGANGGICTPTEAILVQHDIDRGYVTAPGPELQSGNPVPCYECLFGAGCLDDSIYGDTGYECSDVPAGGTTTSAQCLTTLGCLMSTGCAAISVNACYCGTVSSMSCNANTVTTDGACAAPIAAGLGFPVSDGADNIAHLTDQSFASGLADQIFLCALMHSCTACSM
jgi:hypothetical protein